MAALNKTNPVGGQKRREKPPIYSSKNLLPEQKYAVIASHFNSWTKTTISLQSSTAELPRERGKQRARGGKAAPIPAPSPEQGPKATVTLHGGKILTELRFPLFWQHPNPTDPPPVKKIKAAPLSAKKLPSICSPTSEGVRDKHLTNTTTCACPRGALCQEGCWRLLHRPTGRFAQPQ